MLCCVLLQIKLSENGDTDSFEVITLSEEECTLSSRQERKLSETILKKSSNPAFAMDSQVNMSCDLMSCAVLCCGVLCCAVLSCAVLCCTH
jgi:hypothetical protein